MPKKIIVALIYTSLILLWGGEEVPYKSDRGVAWYCLVHSDLKRPSLELSLYRKHPQISRTFFPKIVAQNRGCGLSAGTFQKGAVHFSELIFL